MALDKLLLLGLEELLKDKLVLFAYDEEDGFFIKVADRGTINEIHFTVADLNFERLPDIRQAIKAALDYEEVVIDESPRKQTCFKCDKQIVSDHSSHTKFSHCHWNRGTGVEFTAGYGSSHDLSNFEIVICDSCLTQLNSN